MKCALSLLMTLVLFLCGCNNSNAIDSALNLRHQLHSAACGFDTQITADYGEKIYNFEMHCEVDKNGALQFMVTRPESIAGISGTITDNGAQIDFDGTALGFSLLADGQLTPVSAPWVLISSLRGGYINAAGYENDILRLSIDDSYAEDALRLDVWIDEKQCPVRGEILWKNRRIVSVDVSNFTFM